MTSTQPRRGPSTPSPVGGPPRTWRMYRFYDDTGALLYIGITGRVPFRRLMEHVCDKPWAGEMARWEVDPQVWATEADVLAAEKAAIRAEKPRYNWEHNEGNPDRVWAPPVRRAPVALPLRRRSPAEVVLTSRWTWYTVAYLAVVAVAWWLLGWAAGAVHLVLPSGWHLALAALLPPAVLLAAWARTRRPRRRRRR